ncbi:MAG: DUF2793 domain-containing protein [Pseudomonadota bacterium]
MSDLSAVLSLPYLQPSQAQKHVTHNEALRQLDLVVQLRVTAIDSQTPAPLPQDGEIYALGDTPTGAWAGQARKLAAWLDGSWHFIEPGVGWRAWDLSVSRLMVWDGTEWGPLPVETQNLDGIGIGTASDSVNRLSLRSEASLLNHDGADHRLKINKAADTDTAALLFQSGWTGHAEIGLAGETALSFKTSPDGTTWHEALRLDPASGRASGDAVQANATDTTPGRLMRADFGYCPGNLVGPVAQSAGVPTGSVIEHGTGPNGEYIRYADGTQICWGERNVGSGTAEGSGTFSSPYRSASANISLPAEFSTPPVVHVFCSYTGSVALGGRIMIPTYGITATTITSFRAHRLNTVSTDVDVIAQFLAIGRWI